MNQGLGRLIIPDERDTRFPMQSILHYTAPAPPIRYWWANGWWGDQEWTPWCVAYSWLHYIEDGPTTWAPRLPGADPVRNPGEMYRRAQLVDEWPGEGYDGTSVRAGAKVLQAEGLISGYRWAWDLDTTLVALRTAGPVVVGTWWYESMFTPDSRGLLSISGPRQGGHAYLLNGVNMREGIVRIKNSWGRGWGRNGFGYLRFEDLSRLIHEDGEVCLATEVRRDA